VSSKLVYLLDVNVLISLLWPSHEHHQLVQSWFTSLAKNAWATCPYTQMGFVRILSNPAFSRGAVVPAEAMRVLNLNLSHSTHTFWPDELSVNAINELFSSRLRGHKQLGDAYLLATAMKKSAKLATLDKSIIHLLPDANSQRQYVELIRA
jgi:uncharacterized protein